MPRMVKLKSPHEAGRGNYSASLGSIRDRAANNLRQSASDQRPHLHEDTWGKWRQLFDAAPVVRSHSHEYGWWKYRNGFCQFHYFIQFIKKKKRKTRKQRPWWSTQFYLKRKFSNVNNICLLNDLLIDKESGQFRNFVRMSEGDFNFLLNAVKAPGESRRPYWINDVRSEEIRVKISCKICRNREIQTKNDTTNRLSIPVKCSGRSSRAAQMNTQRTKK